VRRIIDNKETVVKQFNYGMCYGLHYQILTKSGTTWYGHMTMVIALSDMLWPLMALAIALFAQSRPTVYTKLNVCTTMLYL